MQTYRPYKSDQEKVLLGEKVILYPYLIEKKITRKSNFQNAIKRKLHQIEKLKPLLNRDWEPITHNYLYNKKTGEIFSLRYAKILTVKTKIQYIALSYGGVTMPAHKYIWEFYNNKKVPIGYCVDHINRNTTDNRLVNLRMITHAKNQENSSTMKNNKLGILGLSIKIETRNPVIGKTKIYRVTRRINGKMHDKKFITEIAAANYSNYLTHQVNYRESAACPT